MRVVELKCRYATLITDAVYGEALQQDKQKYASYTFKSKKQKTKNKKQKTKNRHSLPVSVLLRDKLITL